MNRVLGGAALGRRAAHRGATSGAGRKEERLWLPGDARQLPVAATPDGKTNARLESTNDRQFDVSADGQRLLLNRTLSTDKVPIVVAPDWTGLLARLAR